MGFVRLLVLLFLWKDRQDKPEISLPERVMEGEQITVQCTAPGRCAATALKITWGPGALFKFNESFNTDDPVGTKRYNSTLTFTASRKHHNKSLNCEAYFPAVNISNNVFLNVEYPPAAPEIFVKKIQDIPMPFPNGSSVRLLEGSKCTLRCTVDSNPLSHLTWMRGEHILKESVISSKSLELVRRHVTSSSDGAYHCEAVNKHGKETSLITVSVDFFIVTDPPRTPQIKVEKVTTP
ncbi:hypothetical protein NDU88_010883, partial [Pleurodeles waltl]